MEAYQTILVKGLVRAHVSMSIRNGPWARMSERDTRSCLITGRARSSLNHQIPSRIAFWPHCRRMSWLGGGRCFARSICL
jgi:hypothetical protein